MNNLVLSGGANKGIGHIGCLKALEEFKLLDNINNCSNTAIIELFHNISINNEHIYINLNKSLKNYTVEIFDNTGKKLTSLINQNNSVAISLSKYMSGLYTLRVISNQNVYTQNIIVTK